MDKIVLILILVSFLLLNFKIINGKNISERLLKILFLYVFIYGALEYFGLSGFVRKFMIDILVGLLLIAQIQRTKYKFPGIKWFLVLSGLILFSAAISSSRVYPTFTYYRTFLYPYVVFLTVYNLRMNEAKWLSFNQFIFALFILQIVASVFKMSFIGINEKFLIGTVSIIGGTFSTVLPLTAVAFICAFFMFYKQDFRYILLVIGFLFMAYMGAKRGIWIYTPVILLLGIFFFGKITTSLERGTISKRLIGLSVFILLFSTITLIFGAKYTRSLNPENTRGGRFDMDYLQEYAVEYTFSTSDDKIYTLGRGANFLSVTRQMINTNSINSWFGYGPESGKGIRTYGEGIWSNLKVNGPVTGLTYHLVQIGLISNLLIILIGFRIAAFFLRITKNEPNRYWKSFCFGSFLVVIVFLVDYLTYSNSFFSTIFPLSFSLAYVSALVVKRKQFQQIFSIKDDSRSTSGNNHYPFI